MFLILYMTSNSYFRKVFKIENTLPTWSNSTDLNIFNGYEDERKI